MTSSHERYSELVTLTKSYLEQEFSRSDRLFSESETYTYFKTYALKQQGAKAAPHQTASPVVKKQNPIPQPIPTEKHPNDKLSAAQQIQNPRNKEIQLPPQPVLDALPTKTETAKEQSTVKVETVSESQVGSTRVFTPELPAAIPQKDFAELRKIFKEKLPHVQLSDTTPDDTEAKALSSIWAQKKQIPQVLILSFDEPPKHQMFLANIAKALEVHGLSAQVGDALKLEQANEWTKLLESKELKLVITSNSGFHTLPGLQKNHRESAKQGRHYVGDRLLLLLSDISFYLKEPALKASLWGAIKELLSSASLAT